MKECLVQIVEKSSTLFERLNNDRFEPAGSLNESRITFRLNKWMQYVADGDPDLFEKRLAFDALKLESIRHVLDDVHLRNQEELPPWTQTLEAIIKNAAYIDSEDPKAPPFHQSLIPMVNTASNKLKEAISDLPHLFTSSALSELEASLLRKLSGLCARTFALEMNVARLLGQLRGESAEDRYQNFLQTRLGHPEALLAFFMDYPVLARLVALVMDQWIVTTTELVFQLRVDLPEIQELFADNQPAGKVQGIVDSLSDPHHQGRTTKKITFESGLQVIYKPRNLTIDVAFHQLLHSINARNVMPALKCFKVLNKHTYGWVEFLEAQNWKEDRERANFYQRAGMLLALFHWLGASDCHLDNLFFCGEHPVLVDMETLLFLNRALELPSESADDRATLFLRHSVLNTGMLPLKAFGDFGKKGIDLSGLSEEASQQIPFLRPVWHQQGTDAMRISMEYITLPPPWSRSMEASLNVSSELSDEIVHGFQQMYEFLLAYKEVLFPASSDLFHGTIRHTVRSTQEYFLILQPSLEPTALRDGIDLSIALDLLWRSIFKRKIEIDSKVLVAEREALEQLDIPYFYAQPHQRVLHSDHDRTIEHFFSESSRESVLARIASMNQKDLQQQLKMIRAALHVRSPATTMFSVSVPSAVHTMRGAQFIEEAIRIADQLRSEAIYGKDGTMTWIGTEYHPALDQYELHPLSEGLYNGKCGVALFFAALECLSPSCGYDELAFSCLQSIRNRLSGKNGRSYANSVGGGMSGIGSICYCLLRTGELLNKRELAEDARQFGRLITIDSIEKDRQHDVVAGSAGTLLCLLALHRAFPGDVFLPVAIACGNKMLQHIHREKLAGFSHGASGFAYALCSLYQITGDQKFRNAALEAIAYENSLFSADAQNWRDLRNKDTKSGEPQFMTSWCHGAPGIGLARIASLDSIDFPEIRSNIETALATTTGHNWDGTEDLCCGNFGRIDILIQASHTLRRPELAALACNTASALVVRAHQSGTYRISVGGADPICNPGMMKGLSGIGYTLLRLADEERMLPSVLLLQ